MAIPLSSWTWFIFAINGAIDRGVSAGVSPGEMLQHIEEGDLFDFLSQDEALAHALTMYEQDQAASQVLRGLRALTGIDSRKKFGVEFNGMCLLIALATEIVQRELPSGGTFDASRYE